MQLALVASASSLSLSLLAGGGEPLFFFLLTWYGLAVFQEPVNLFRKALSRMGQSWLMPSGVAFCVMVLMGFLCLPFDLPIAKAMLSGVTPGELRGIFARGEVFGHAYGMVAIAFTIYLLSPKNRSAVPRLILNCVVAGLTADLLKVAVWRIRPRSDQLLEVNSDTFLGTIFTNTDWTWAQLIDSNRHSFPSAHTAVAVAFAISLAKLFPEGRWWFALLALVCALNRIDGGAHFPSDVFWGAAVGIATTAFCAQSRGISRLLNRWESKVGLTTEPQATISYRKSA